MKFRRLLRRKPDPIVTYWVNGWGPFYTEAERDQMHELLRDVVEHNQKAIAVIQREEPR